MTGQKEFDEAESYFRRKTSKSRFLQKSTVQPRKSLENHSQEDKKSNGYDVLRSRMFIA